MPTIPSIRTSVENQGVLILDEHARNGIFRRDDRGRLLAYSGGFSVVFPYNTANNKKWAFRCWHSDVKNSKKRYEIVSKAIQKAQLDFLCDFEYIEKGINVEGKVYPITRMKWINGITIKDYICQNRNSKYLLKELADKFLSMTRDLHRLSLAHGDLQHGNILVSNNKQLYLVDYDSFYCPQLKGEADNVTGLPDYQHPARINNKSVSEKLDYFSELIIYLSILAIAEVPSLTDKYKVVDSDRLLFSKEDFADINNAPIYNDIYSLGADFQDMLAVLEEYLNHKNIDDLVPFELCLLQRKISFSASTTKAVRNTQFVELVWNIPFDAEVLLRKGKDKDFQQRERQGKLTTTLPESTTFELLIKISDEQVLKREIFVEVFDECEIEFFADKKYSYPSVPIVLSWKVSHAQKIFLDSEEVMSDGCKIVYPDRDIAYTLSTENELGKKQKVVKIEMLPIPLIKTIMVSVPDIKRNLHINIKRSQYNVNLNLPEIKTKLIDIVYPSIPSLTDLGINVTLSPPLERFSIRKTIKNIYNKLIKKQNENREKTNTINLQ